MAKKKKKNTKGTFLQNNKLDLFLSIFYDYFLLLLPKQYTGLIKTIHNTQQKKKDTLTDHRIF
jgi:hypothetical protein